MYLKRAQCKKPESSRSNIMLGTRMLRLVKTGAYLHPTGIGGADERDALDILVRS
jgi:hypothetical protein